MKRPAKRTARAKAPGAVKAAAVPVAGPFYLKLDPCCTLREAADLQRSLLAADGNPVVVDGSAVERIDTAALQLLVALVNRQHRAGRRLEWKAASPEILSCGRRLGLIGALDLAGGGGAVP